jgi:TonB-dependent receptor
MRTPAFTDQTKSAQLSVSRTLDWGGFSGLDIGIAYNQRDKDVTSDAYRLLLTDGAEEVIPASALRDSVTIEAAGIKQQVLSWDVPSIMGMYTASLKDPWLAQTNKFNVNEKVKTAFLRLNIGAELGPVPVRGNLGVQYVRSEQASDGFAWNDGPGTPDGGAVVPLHGGATYSDVLPSLNLAFNLKEDLLLRFALGKTMARPRMDDMRAGADQPTLSEIISNPGFGTWSANGGGNPELKPWRAKSVDLSLEKYFEKRSYIQVAGFLKKLDSFIYERTTRRDFSGTPNYNPLLTPGCELSQPDCDPNIGTFTTQNNGTGGKVYGLELSVTLDGGLFTDALEGFGVQLSGSKTYNKLPKDEDDNPINLDGFSDNVHSFAAYFERGGFSARISQNYRSAFTATTRSVLLGTLRSTQIDAQTSVDAQLGYSFESGTLAGLTLLLQGNNLGNDRSITRQSPETVGSAGSSTGLLPSVDENFGRVLLFGASYKL